MSEKAVSYKVIEKSMTYGEVVTNNLFLQLEETLSGHILIYQ